MTETPPGIPPALDAFVVRLRETAGSGLVALLAYGSLATGDYVPDVSDVNLLLVLESADVETLRRLGPVLREARRELGVDPFVVTRGELPRVADVFPVKLRAIRLNHLVLAGENPLDGIEVGREHLRLRTEQALRNHLLRLRRRYLEVQGDDASLRWLLVRASGTLFVVLEALLYLSGHEVPPGGGYAAVGDAAAEHLGLDAAVLGGMLELRRGDDVEDPEGLFDGVIALLEAAIGLADGLAS